MLIDLDWDQKHWPYTNIPIKDFVKNDKEIKYYVDYNHEDLDDEFCLHHIVRHGVGIYEYCLNLKFQIRDMTSYEEDRHYEYENNSIPWHMSYGVADNIQQILEQCPWFLTTEKEFVLELYRVKKSEQSDWGGWRWHKWGEYIGTQTPTTEYIYDEPVIEEVLVFGFIPIIRKDFIAK